MTFIDRDQAVHTIAAHLADRTAFVMFIPPAQIPTASIRLRDVPGWTAYIDSATEAVICIGDADMLTVVDIVTTPLTPITAVVCIPKTVPATVLSKALGQHIPEDGSQDIIGLRGRDEPTIWPVLFVDALAQVDPDGAAWIRANGVEAMS